MHISNFYISENESLYVSSFCAACSANSCLPFCLLEGNSNMVVVVVENLNYVVKNTYCKLGNNRIPTKYIHVLSIFF